MASSANMVLGGNMRLKALKHNKGVYLSENETNQDYLNL